MRVWRDTMKGGDKKTPQICFHSFFKRVRAEGSFFNFKFLISNFETISNELILNDLN